MKDLMKIFAVFSVLLLLIPTVVFKSDGKNSKSQLDSLTLEQVLVLDEENGEISQIKLSDYLVGCVLAQMPYDYETEALRSQAVICRTYIYYRRLCELTTPNPDLLGADVSSNENIYQKYFSQKEAQDYYGEEYEDALAACRQAVFDTKGQIITYEGEPIVTAFHALSSGSTESSKNAWGVEVPYLQTVDSDWDKDVNGAKKEYNFTLNEIFARTRTLSGYENMKDDFSLEITKISSCGNVLCLTLLNGGEQKNLSGSEFAAALNMRSACFEVKNEDDGSLSFSCVGVGHMVGLSQYGANQMAKEGFDYKDIIAHYFTGAEVSDLL